MSDALKESPNAEPTADIAAAIAQLPTIADGTRLLQGDEAAEYAIDEVAPQAVVFPSSAEEVAAVLQFAGANGLTVFPRGGGTQLGLGNVPERVDIVLSLELLKQIVAHEPADMTVTVEAGLPLVELQAALRRSGQFLPVDPPIGPEATIGGILATRAFGPHRFSFRTIADSLLGVTVVTADGRVTKAGGRVVKNVSGYELGRLYSGSMGTLAVIVEATFKVQPLARTRQAFLATCRDAKAAQKEVRRLLASGVQPAFLELVGPVAFGDAQVGAPAKPVAKLLQHLEPLGSDVSFVLAVGFVGTPEDVAWQLETAERTLKTTHNGHSAPKTVRAGWESVYPHVIDVHKGDPDAGSLTCRVHTPDTELYAFLEGLAQSGSEGESLRFAAHVGSGIVRFHWKPTAQSDGVEGAVQRISAWREQARAVGGRLIVERAPNLVKSRVDVWGPPGDDFFLHQAVKERMDPKRVLSPGRFVGGI